TSSIYIPAVCRLAPTTLSSSYSFFFLSLLPPPPISTLFPYTTLFRSFLGLCALGIVRVPAVHRAHPGLSVRSDGASESSARRRRSEEHTSELQSRVDLVCRLLLEKKKENR